jgi:hypothetical protein
MRRIPELEARLDDSLERGTRVLQILNDLEAGKLPDEVATPGESLPTPVRRLPHEGDLPEPESAVLPLPEPKKRRRPVTERTSKPRSKPGPKPGGGDGRRGTR